MPTRDECLVYLNTEIEKLKDRLTGYKKSPLRGERHWPSYNRAIEQRQRLIAERDRLLGTLRNSGRSSGVRARKTRPGDDGQKLRARVVISRLRRNVDRFRKECGWSFDELAAKTGIDKKQILSHVNKGAKPHPRTLKEYAQAFAKELGRPVTVAELEE